MNIFLYLRFMFILYNNFLINDQEIIFLIYLSI
jgi:hypothetical protein